MNFQYLKNFMDYMAENRSPGNAVEVRIGNECVFKYAKGYRDLETKTQLSGDEYFNIYSCSKITTVTAALQLLEKGKFLLTDPLYDYIPEYKTMFIKDNDGNVREAKDFITVGDLFSMTAGLTYNTNSDGIKKAEKLTNGKMNTDVVVRCIAEDPISFEPGENWQYSLCHDVLAGMVGIIEGKPFREYVKENIFDPLGMTQSVYHITDEIKENMASQYRFVPNGAEGTMDMVEAQKYGRSNDGTFVNIGKDADLILGEEYDSGGAGITTTVSDYIKLMEALANFGIGATGERILSKNTVELLRTNRLNEKQLKNFNWRQLTGYGYGLGVRTLIDKAKAGSTGNLGEFGWGGAAGATAIIDPSIKLSVFYAQHCLNPREEYYQPRLRNVVYSCLDK